MRPRPLVLLAATICALLIFRAPAAAQEETGAVQGVELVGNHHLAIPKEGYKSCRCVQLPNFSQGLHLYDAPETKSRSKVRVEICTTGNINCSRFDNDNEDEGQQYFVLNVLITAGTHYGQQKSR